MKNKYAKGDLIFFVRYIENSGIQEVLKLKIRTTSDDYIVGCTDKGVGYLLGSDSESNIFKNIKDANSHLKKTVKVARYEEVEIPNQ